MAEQVFYLAVKGASKTKALFKFRMSPTQVVIGSELPQFKDMHLTLHAEAPPDFPKKGLNVTKQSSSEKILRSTLEPYKPAIDAAGPITILVTKEQFDNLADISSKKKSVDTAEISFEELGAYNNFVFLWLNNDTAIADLESIRDRMRCPAFGIAFDSKTDKTIGIVLGAGAGASSPIGMTEDEIEAAATTRAIPPMASFSRIENGKVVETGQLIDPAFLKRITPREDGDQADKNTS